MGGLKLEAEERTETTQISNLFLDRYMPRANGEYIKIYLLLLRQLQTPGWELSLSSIADYLDCTEKDVSRGLAYWEREGVLSLRFDPQKQLSGIMLLDLRARVAAAAERILSEAESAAAGEETQAVSGEVKIGKKKSEKAVPDMVRLSSDEVFSQLIGVASAYKKKPLSHEDCNILAYLYDTLGMSGELLEYLVESCVEGGITSIRTMEKIAIGWHERQITTPQQAEAMQTIYRQDMWKIMKAFGLGGRNPGNSEKKMMEKWLMQYGFDSDVILEACDRTMRQIQKPSFEYTDRILASWKSAGVRTKKDIDAVEKAAREAKGEKAQTGFADKAVRTGTKTNRFHNYTQRNTDYDSLIARHDALMTESGDKRTTKQDED